MDQSAAPPAAIAPGPLTLAVVNGRVWTADPSRPWAEALAVRDDELALVGSSDEIRQAAGSARVIDAQGRLVIPGFIDAHIHFLDGGFRLSSVQLRDARTPQAFTARIRDFAAAARAGTWILGGDWDHEQWGGELPRREWIDGATPDRPVWVNRLDGHMALANGAALRAAGITRETPDVPGGTIVRDERGEPTGVLKDHAMSLVDRAVPHATPEMKARALEAAMRHVAEQGVTSVHHMGSWEDLAIFTEAWKAGRLTTRIYAAVPLATWPRLRDTVAAGTYPPAGRGDDWLRIGALKGFPSGPTPRPSTSRTTIRRTIRACSST